MGDGSDQTGYNMDSVLQLSINYDITLVVQIQSAFEGCFPYLAIFTLTIRSQIVGAAFIWDCFMTLS